jgi:hypothetical protein
MSGSLHLSRVRWLALALGGFLVVAGVAAYGSSAQSSRLGTLSTIDLCIVKAGPEKGSVSFVQRKQRCKPGEMRVQVVSGSSKQDVLGIAASSGSAGSMGPRGVPGAPGPAGTPAEYVRIESASPIASGDPETASVTVTCPGEASVVSGGYEVEAGTPAAGNNPAEVVVTESRATSAGSWAVTAFAADATAVGPWSVTAHAICAA